MNKQALVKLAKVRLAINYVLRNRLTKQAADATIMPESATSVSANKPRATPTPQSVLYGGAVGGYLPVMTSPSAPTRYMKGQQRITNGIDNFANKGHSYLDSYANKANNRIDRVADFKHGIINTLNSWGNSALDTGSYWAKRVINPRYTAPYTQRQEYQPFSGKHIDSNGDPWENQEYYDNLPENERTPEMERALLQSQLNYFNNQYNQGNRQ